MSETQHCPHCGKALPSTTIAGLCPECMLRLGASRPTEWPDETVARGTKDDRPPPPSPEEMAKHFPQLEILECLGRGGMGVVYKARQPKLNRVVALKILAPERGSEQRFSERFEREAQTLARLSHPNIVAVHDFGEADGVYYLLMEYVAGRSLRDVLRAGTITPEQALAIVPPICEALQFAHEHGVVHRDIKPENVLLDQQGRVKIADFGIAKLVGEERRHPALTEDRQVIGTPHYMAPEQVEKPQLVDHRADIYSLGVVFYEMLTGELPLGKFAPPSRKVLVDVRLDEVVLHALEKEPEQRYQKASEVKTAVEGIATGRQVSPSESEPSLQPAAVRQAMRPSSRTKGSEGTEETGRGGLGGVPPVLWVAVLAMIGTAIWKWAAFPRNPLWLLADALLVTGLIYRYKLAYTATLFFAVLGTAFTAAAGPLGLAVPVLLLNGAVTVPVLLCTGWFFPRNRACDLRPGGDLVAGILFSLPPMAFLWFVRGGYALLGVDLDADVRFFAGAFGLPVSAAGGALLALLARPLLGRFDCSATRVISPDAPRRWSAWAIGAAALWVISLPLGGAATVMLDLMGQDSHWNPGPVEAVFTLTLGALAVLTVLGSIILGIEALRRMRTDPVRSRGWLGAVAAAWVWPVLLCTVFLTSSQTSDHPNAEGTARAAAQEQSRLEAMRKVEANRGFEPVREIVLRRASDLDNAFLSLETGRILSAPDDLVGSLKTSGQLSPAGGVQVLSVLDWMREVNADLICRDGASGLTLVDGVAILMSEGGDAVSSFDSLSAFEVRGAVDAMAETLVLRTNLEPKGLTLYWFDAGEGTNTWGIRTRAGRSGLLELRSSQIQPDHIRFRTKLVASPKTPPATPFLGTSTRRQHLRLFNNAELEIVGVCRNPRNAPEWRGSDGTPLMTPPVEIIKLPALARTRRSVITVKPENEFLVYARWTLPEGVRIHSTQPSFNPRPSDWETSALVLDLERNKRSTAELFSFDNVPGTVTYEVAVSFGPWTAVSAYDLESRTAEDVSSGTMALWSEPRYDREAGALRYEVMHNVDRRTYALRMRALFRNGTAEKLVFHSGTQSGSPTKGFALIHGTEAETSAELADLRELALERTPWVRCEIPEVVLRPPADAGEVSNRTRR